MEAHHRRSDAARRDGTAQSAGTAAGEIIKALALPAADPVLSPPQPLPLSRLPELPRETSMMYGIGRMDSSGRIAATEIIQALRWRPGDQLELTLTPSAAILRPAAGGLLGVPQRPCVVIPAGARRLLDIAPADHVLLAAAPEYRIVIVHAIRVMDDMLAAFHAGSCGTRSNGYE